ncbi:SHOCT domain-containing protein [Pontibacter anaerobius]|uniref:SHOCT domain-containing protein n=1 Tax=Pontibacter anaerobius TaxID=2993940 RepID=A0ABT3RHC0_9BACT|nr:SHOCT domain-containing protein [Pontibacter anaerobius]MCX2740841.1 SHOCT domain-containing protein [Pontibacter anaerobius]
MWHMDGDWHYWGMHMFWWIFWVIAALFFFGYLISVGKNQRTFQQGGRETPLDILKRRYASGEIDTAEYELRKRELEKGS